ncbi:MAG: prepilin-type N-terminal cleavage/methylation domain-containing protein [Candidatus Omnitrophota bacterium]
MKFKSLKRRYIGFTLVEIVVVVAIVSILAAIAIPMMLRAKHNANESAAHKSLQAICSACSSYFGEHNIYPDSLEQLGSETPPYISEELAAGTKDGYAFTYEPTNGNFAFTCIAEPQMQNITGTKTFIIDQTGIITEEEQEE